MTLARSLTASARPNRAFATLRRLFLLSPAEADFATRGFPASDPARREALEAAGRAFIGGYNAALTAASIDDLLAHLAACPQPMRGFAAEGAGMGIAIGDALSLGRARLSSFIAATERDFTYLVHVGAGWAIARTPWRRRAILKPLDSAHGWLAFDGLGFHDAYFNHSRIAAGWRRETQGYAARAYDQGIGRALWFVSGGDAPKAARLIAALPEARHGDLWSGLGLAMAYAGPAGSDEFTATLHRAATRGAAFAQGVAFACEARARARCIPDATELAARAIWGRNAGTIASLVRDARQRLPDADGEVPRYEIWRRDVACIFTPEPPL